MFKALHDGKDASVVANIQDQLQGGRGWGWACDRFGTMTRKRLVEGPSTCDELAPATDGDGGLAMRVSRVI